MTTRATTAGARRFGYALVLFWTIRIAYNVVQIARCVPDAFRGQHRGSMLLDFAWLLLCAGQLASSPRVRHALLLAAWIPIVAAFYLLGLFVG